MECDYFDILEAVFNNEKVKADFQAVIDKVVNGGSEFGSYSYQIDNTVRTAYVINNVSGFLIFVVIWN